jgi:hypothetical protein
MDLGVPVRRGFVQHDRYPPHLKYLPLAIAQAQPLLIDVPRRAAPFSLSAAEQLPLERAMLANGEAGAPRRDAEQEPQGAEIAIGQPQSERLHQRQDVGPQRAFLSLAVLGEQDGAGGQSRLVEDDQALAGQRSGPGGAQLGEAVLGGFQVVAVEDLGVVTLQPGGMAGSQGPKERGGLARGVTDQGRGDGQFHALKFFIESRVGDADAVAHGLVGGVNGGLAAEDHLGHKFDGCGEQQVTGVLLLGGTLEQLVEP